MHFTRIKTKYNLKKKKSRVKENEVLSKGTLSLDNNVVGMLVLFLWSRGLFAL